jgi:hypothetical protein
MMNTGGALAKHTRPITVNLISTPILIITLEILYWATERAQAGAPSK